MAKDKVLYLRGTIVSNGVGNEKGIHFSYSGLSSGYLAFAGT